MIGCKVFIGNLSEDATGENVEYLFQNFGEIVEIQLIDGFGFIEYNSSQSAYEAIDNLNGYDLCGHQINLEIAKIELDPQTQLFRPIIYPEDFYSEPSDEPDPFDSPIRSGYEHTETRRERPYRTEYTVLVENLSSSCRYNFMESDRNMKTVDWLIY